MTLAILIGPQPVQRPNSLSAKREMEYVMASSLMKRTQQRLGPGTALRVVAAHGPRLLSVVEGRVWLTGEGIEGDLWLRAGEQLTLAAGTEIVAEGWPSARFDLLEAAPAHRVSVWRGLAWTRRRASEPACA